MPTGQASNRGVLFPSSCHVCGMDWPQLRSTWSPCWGQADGQPLSEILPMSWQRTEYVEKLTAGNETCHFCSESIDPGKSRDPDGQHTSENYNPSPKGGCKYLWAIMSSSTWAEEKKRKSPFRFGFVELVPVLDLPVHWGKNKIPLDSFFIARESSRA